MPPIPPSALRLPPKPPVLDTDRADSVVWIVRPLVAQIVGTLERCPAERYQSAGCRMLASALMDFARGYARRDNRLIESAGQFLVWFDGILPSRIEELTDRDWSFNRNVKREEEADWRPGQRSVRPGQPEH